MIIELREQPKSAEDQARDAQDKAISEAQGRDLVKFNGWLVAVGAVQSVAVFIQAWLLARSMADNRDNLQVAKQSAEAAQLSAEAAKAASVVQATAERAWLGPTGVHLSAYGPTGRSESFALAVKWANPGRTPALNCKIRGEHRVVAIGSPVPQFGIRDLDEIPRFAPIMPGAVVGGPERRLSLDDTLAVARAEKQLFVWGHVEYTDTFGIARHTQVCTEVKIGPPEELLKTKGAVQVSPWAIGPQNSAT